jgi:hypothetical protein
MGALITTLVVVTGCAGGPKYGASGKRSKSCDCPHWNAVPKQEGRELWSKNDNLPRTTEHGHRN